MREVRYNLSEIVATYVEYNDRDGDDNTALRWCYVDPDTERPTEDGILLFEAVKNLWRYFDVITASVDFQICRCYLTKDERSIVLSGSYD